MTQRLITRKEWGATAPDGFRDRPLPISEWWLHHSVTIAPDLVEPFTDDDAAIRTLERIGQSRFGGGISYTFPVTPVGRIYQGHSMHRQGAHTKGHNTAGAAFVLVGDYSKRAPTSAQRDRIAERMVIEHRAGRATRHRLNGGHRDASGNSTACPGDAAHAAIGDINARADRLWAAGYPTTPKPTPPPAPPTPKRSTMFQQLVQLEGTDPVFVTDLIRRRWVYTAADLVVVKAELKAAGLPTTVKVVKDIDPYGEPIGRDPLQAGQGE